MKHREATTIFLAVELALDHVFGDDLDTIQEVLAHAQAHAEALVAGEAVFSSEGVDVRLDGNEIADAADETVMVPLFSGTRQYTAEETAEIEDGSSEIAAD
jgi:hypothetical protein